MMDQGHFEGKLITEWLDDGRLMKTVDSFRYVSRAGVYWDVPMGTETDGAGIPRILWSLMGGPFSGKYRKAAVVHDYYCACRIRAWEDTHRMFWEAMLTAGVGEATAETMYRVVYIHGPRWHEDGSDIIREISPEDEW